MGGGRRRWLGERHLPLPTDANATQGDGGAQEGVDCGPAPPLHVGHRRSHPMLGADGGAPRTRAGESHMLGWPDSSTPLPLSAGGTGSRRPWTARRGGSAASTGAACSLLRGGGHGLLVERAPPAGRSARPDRDCHVPGCRLCGFAYGCAKEGCCRSDNRVARICVAKPRTRSVLTARGIVPVLHVTVMSI